MTTLYDATVQHQGWFGGTFATGQWENDVAPLITGLNARSFWMESLNGQAIDMSLGFVDSAGNRTSPIWVNTHTVGPVTGVTIPSPHLITPADFVAFTTRSPTSTGQILARFLVSDQSSTPPPTVPP